MAKKNITTNDLNKMMKTGFDDLGRMIKAGFDDVDKRFNEADKGFKSLEDGQDEIKTRLSNVAYRFELQELEQKVAFLEKKLNNFIKVKK